MKIGSVSKVLLRLDYKEGCSIREHEIDLEISSIRRPEHFECLLLSKALLVVRVKPPKELLPDLFQTTIDPDFPKALSREQENLHFRGHQ